MEEQKSTYDWTNDLKLDKNSAVLPILSNLILFLTHHQAWQGVYAYDAFAARVIIRKRPPWGEETPDTPCTDHHEAKTRVWFQREDIKASGGDVGRAIQAAARDNPYHPVRDYLEALKWDGVPRLDTWLIDHCHAADTVADGTVYVRAVSRRFPISAVARIYQPGCKVDHMPILEGPQGKQKSEALRALAVKDAWFTDRLSHVSSKDAQQEAGGRVAGRDRRNGAADTRLVHPVQSNMSPASIDRFRPPYGKHVGTFPRQCVFVGTINPPVGGYFTDATGNRRFWPIFCPDMIDLDGIKRDRDQLWAEAVHAYKAGEKWWMETPELEALATAEQNARFRADVWQETVEHWLSKSKDPKDTKVSEVLEGAWISSKDPTLQGSSLRKRESIRFSLTWGLRNTDPAKAINARTVTGDHER